MNPILKWVLRTMMKDQTGVMRTLPKKDLVDFNVNMTIERLLQNRIDPSTIKTPGQLDNIIKQIEAPRNVQTGIKNTKSAKIFDMKGKEIPKGSKIMGGEAVEKKGLSDRDFRSEKTSFRLNIAKNSPDFNQDLADRIIKREIYTDLSDSQRKQFLDDLDFVLKNPRDGNADGGVAGERQNFAMGKRAFLKMLAGAGAGLAGLKTGALSMFGKGAGKQVATEVAKDVATTSGAPPYFFNLVKKIKNLGDEVPASKDKAVAKQYKDYVMEEDFQGNIEIKKTKEAMIPGGDEAGISEEVYMTYRPGIADETTKGRKVVDEYEEFTAKPDIDGKMKDVEGGVPDEVIEEGTMFEDNITDFGKADGGIARMLGE